MCKNSKKEQKLAAERIQAIETQKRNLSLNMHLLAKLQLYLRYQKIGKAVIFTPSMHYLYGTDNRTVKPEILAFY